jgi:hypothetical protein
MLDPLHPFSMIKPVKQDHSNPTANKISCRNIRLFLINKWQSGAQRIPEKCTKGERGKGYSRQPPKTHRHGEAQSVA